MRTNKKRNRGAYHITTGTAKRPILKRIVRQNRHYYRIGASVLTEEQMKEVIQVRPEKKKLTKEEKKALHKRLAGSTKLFSKEGVLESLRIANREEWED
ncbi:hypothetical protein [Anoxybacillus flavithermus]|uniref:Uncharacterized protein n=1 Tax=Anoxybacillus flavithermus AK1 TaxID=1297581 RepID=M8CWB5_9BACL|nr:hypothetical protein [Anoxybacillus flavithermus]EMT45803.1 hypothetical protein H919_08500 [Anoxybacillus flavithermus AK1]